MATNKTRTRRERRWRAARWRVTSVLALAMLLVAAPLRAHTLPPETFMAWLRTPAVRDAFGIEDVTRDPGLPRLLVIRVGAGWDLAEATRRQQMAEAWQRDWRHIVPQGIVAILDQKTDRSLVQFDPEGHARLKSVQ